MNYKWFAPGSFMVFFCCAYGLVFAMNWPLFTYYPLHGNFFWGPRAHTGLGPVMVWYGLMSSAGLVALLAALLIPEKVSERALRNYIWLFPLGAMLVCIFLLRQLLFA